MSPSVSESVESEMLLVFVCGPARFSLGLAMYDDRHERDDLIQWVTVAAEKKQVLVTTLEFGSHDHGLLDRLQRHLDEHPTPGGLRRAIMVTEIEHALDYATPDSQREGPLLFARANMQREAFTQACPVPVVLWLRPSAGVDLAHIAPDLWHWRSITFDFTSPERIVRREGELLQMDRASRLSLPRTDRLENLDVLQDLLRQAELDDDSDSRRGLRRRWSLLNQLGEAYRDHARYAEARDTHHKALNLAERIEQVEAVTDDTLIATSSNNLGLVLQDLGDLPGARQAFERALKIYETTLGPEHAYVATEVNNLGLVLQALGDLPGARQAYERALKINETSLGPDHAYVATNVNNLGRVLQDLGDLPGARQAFERALKIDETAFGPDHPNVADDVIKIGTVLQALGDLPGARHAYERALKIDEATFGPDHPNVANRVSILGSVLYALGDLPGATQAFERALKIDEQTFGPENRNVGNRLWWIGRVLQDLGDLPGTKQAFERALAFFQKYHGDEHPETQRLRQELETVDKLLADKQPS